MPGSRTLLVGPDPVRRAWIERLLRERRHDVSVARDADDALELHARERFPLIVVDDGPPSARALECCRRLRALAGGDEAVILVISRATEPDPLTAALEAGATDCAGDPDSTPVLVGHLAMAERSAEERVSRRVAERALRETNAALVAEIAERRRTEETLRESEERFRMLSEANFEGIGVQENGRIVAANRAFAALLGCEPEDLVGKPAIEFAAPESRPVIAEHVAKGYPHPYDVVAVRADGSRFAAELCGKSFTFQGRTVRVTAVRDVTEKNRFQDALARERDFVSTVLDTVGSLVVVLDRDGRIVRMNRACEVALGYSLAEVRGRPGWDFLRHGDESPARDGFARVLEERHRTDYEGSLRAKDGTRRIVTWSATPVVGKGGEVEHIVATGLDVTEKKQLEARLLLSDRMASMGTLAAGVAHEINNPLAYVIMNLDLATKIARGDLRAQGVAEEMLGMLAVAREGAERVREIVGDLKDLARSDDETRGQVDLRAVLDASLKMAMNEIRHRARLVRDYGPVLPVLANQGRLGQVFLNLLLNAAQAIPEGHAHDNEIRVRTLTEGTRSVVLVTDTGAGIPEEALGHVFDPFFTTKPIGVGTGLGLSICHSLVTSLGGEIGVESKVGVGTTFRVALPAQMSVARSSSVRPPPSVQPPSRVRLLVVDDEPQLATLLKLTFEDHDVTIATSGREALELATAREFDVVLCDLMMPEMTGMDVYDELAQTRPGYESRIVFMTGGAFTPRAREFLARVDNATVDKPFDVDVLRRLVLARAASAGQPG